MRAAGLSGPDVLEDASQAFLAHAFAFAKSDTYGITNESRVEEKGKQAAHQHAKLEGVKAERRLVMHQPLLLQEL